MTLNNPKHVADKLQIIRIIPSKNLFSMCIVLISAIQSDSFIEHKVRNTYSQLQPKNI